LKIIVVENILREFQITQSYIQWNIKLLKSRNINDKKLMLMLKKMEASMIKASKHVISQAEIGLHSTKKKRRANNNQ